MHTSIAQAPVVDTSGWDFCPRMSLRAPRLPCGEREECLGCERMGGRKRRMSGSGASNYSDRKCCACGAMYTPVKFNQKYCSAHCQRAAAKAREKQAGKR